MHSCIDRKCRWVFFIFCSINARIFIFICLWMVVTRCSFQGFRWALGRAFVAWRSHISIEWTQRGREGTTQRWCRLWWSRLEYHLIVADREARDRRAFRLTWHRLLCFVEFRTSTGFLVELMRKFARNQREDNPSSALSSTAVTSRE